MKTIRVLIFATSLTLSPLGLISAASASSHPTTTTTTLPATLTPAQYNVAVKQINRAYSDSVKLARNTYKKAMASAHKAPDPSLARLDAMNAYETSIIIATNIRGSALAALGTVPKNPTTTILGIGISPIL